MTVWANNNKTRGNQLCAAFLVALVLIDNWTDVSVAV